MMDSVEIRIRIRSRHHEGSIGADLTVLPEESDGACEARVRLLAEEIRKALVDVLLRAVRGEG
jgi:hypothetical protein